jgi:MoxR-like ATPase
MPKELENVKNIDKLKETFSNVQKEIGKIIVGQEEVMEQILISILCDSNALLESYPGLGKTTMVKTIGEVLDLKFSRIQSTPDLMPSDILGTY